MREGNLQPPKRNPHEWDAKDYWDVQKLDDEMRRVFDICHGCRRCFNLCETFPSLFQLVDDSETGEVESLKSQDFAGIVESCTLCDMCAMVKCPYVPPHEFQLDFPQLMLRYRAVHKTSSWLSRQLAKTDRNGRWLMPVRGVVNALSRVALSRWLLEKLFGVDRRVRLPQFQKAKQHRYPPNPKAPGYGHKVLLYATCFGNYNAPDVVRACQAVLAHNGVDVQVLYEECCQMPAFEQGDLEAVRSMAQRLSKTLLSWMNQGYVIVTPVPSCTFMMKDQWPLIFPDNLDLLSLSKVVMDVCDYLVMLSDRLGLMPMTQELSEKIAIQLSCHARAQGVGHKAVELLKKIPGMDLQVIERCSGHGGTFGVTHFETALKVGAPTARQALKADVATVLSECPLAAKHVAQTMEIIDPDKQGLIQNKHPIEILAQAYGV